MPKRRLGRRTTQVASSRERIAKSPRVTPLVVFLFLSLGLPGVGILAWLVIKVIPRAVPTCSIISPSSERAI